MTAKATSPTLMMTPVCPRLLNMINDFVLLRFRARVPEDLSAIEVIYYYYYYYCVVTHKDNQGYITYTASSYKKTAKATSPILRRHTQRQPRLHHLYRVIIQKDSQGYITYTASSHTKTTKATPPAPDSILLSRSRCGWS